MMKLINLPNKEIGAIARLISAAENFPEIAKDTLDKFIEKNKDF